MPVRIETDEGLVGIGATAPAPAGMIVEGNFAHLLLGEDSANVERLWDQMFRALLPYGRKGLPIMAISAVDIALWDLLGKARGVPRPQDGFLTHGEAPGLGVEIDEEWLDE